MSPFFLIVNKHSWRCVSLSLHHGLPALTAAGLFVPTEQLKTLVMNLSIRPYNLFTQFKRLNETHQTALGSLSKTTFCFAQNKSLSEIFDYRKYSALKKKFTAAAHLSVLLLHVSPQSEAAVTHLLTVSPLVKLASTGHRSCVPFQSVEPLCHATNGTNSHYGQR